MGASEFRSPLVETVGAERIVYAERAFLTNLDGGLVLAAEPQAGSEVQRALCELGNSGIKHETHFLSSDR